MNKRMKKKAEKRKRKQIHELLDLVLDINGLEAREQNITGNLPTAFFEFSGHVGRINIRTYSDGWASGKDTDTEIWPRAYRHSELADAVHSLEALSRNPRSCTSQGIKETAKYSTPLV